MSTFAQRIMAALGSNPKDNPQYQKIQKQIRKLEDQISQWQDQESELADEFWDEEPTAAAKKKLANLNKKIEDGYAKKNNLIKQLDKIK